MTEVLVTGATGLVGRAAVCALRNAGFDVRTVSRGASADYKVDLLDEGSRARLIDEARPRTLLHCAWDTTHGTYWHDPVNLAWASATVDLARRAFDRGTTRFVGVGSCAEYLPSEAPILESDCRPPDTLYGVAKRHTGSLLCGAGERLGVSVAWARLFHLFGPGEDPRRLVPAACEGLRDSGRFRVGAGRLPVDYMPVSEVGRALACLVRSGVDGPVNIASGTPTTVRDLAEEIAGLIGGSVEGPDQPSGLPRLADVGAIGRAGFTPHGTLSEWLRADLRARGFEVADAAGSS